MLHVERAQTRVIGRIALAIAQPMCYNRPQPILRISECFMNRYRNLSQQSRMIFWVILAVMIVVGLIAFFTSETGRNVALVCCGGVILLLAVGLISERSMKRPQ